MQWYVDNFLLWNWQFNFESSILEIKSISHFKKLRFSTHTKTFLFHFSKIWIKDFVRIYCLFVQIFDDRLNWHCFGLSITFDENGLLSLFVLLYGDKMINCIVNALSHGIILHAKYNNQSHHKQSQLISKIHNHVPVICCKCVHTY